MRTNKLVFLLLMGLFLALVLTLFLVAVLRDAFSRPPVSDQQAGSGRPGRRNSLVPKLP